jgi:hypothetical protein
MLKLRFKSVLLVSLLSIPVLISGSNTASALSGNEFKAGRIIDDVVFFNGNALSSTEIQNFLNSKVPVCDTNGTKQYGSTGMTRAQWTAANGRPTPPYTCLKDYTQDIPGKSADGYCQTGIGSGQKTAAQIISEVAKACSVSPKVLIVLLQKEQSLITDDWPWPVQYEKATGYECPDTRPCDPEFAGFFNQVYYAARQYQRYAKQPDLFRYRAGRFNYIQYSPDSNCGGSDVFIANQATAGLYNYTPYQPNQGALDNLYGEAPSCGAYGNRNFWRMYSDWFGSSITDFKWRTDVYQIWNKEETRRLDPGFLQPGEEYVVKVYAQNIGSAVWKNNGPTPVNFATTNLAGHNSFLCHPTWITCSRPGKLLSATVLPGQGGDFKFRIKAPYGVGSYREYFKPVAEMIAWFNGGESLGIRVVSPGTFKWENKGYKIMDEDEDDYLDPGKLEPDSRYMVILRAKNTGTATWRNNSPIPVRLGTNHTAGHNSVLCDSASWLSCGRPVDLEESSIAPGQTGTFKFIIETPSEEGPYREHFKPVAENHAWFNDSQESLGIIVQ